MKKNPHLGQRRSGELGRKARRKKATTAGMMHTIMMMKRRLGFLSMRKPSAKDWSQSVFVILVWIVVQINRTKPNAFRGTVPLRRVSRGVNPKDYQEVRD